MLKHACLLFALLVAPVFAEQKVTEHTWKLSGGQKPPEATVGIMRQFAGTWSGDGMGAWNQETWSEPMEGTMQGMFRQFKDGKPTFYELMTLTPENGTLVMRIRHFGPGLTVMEKEPMALRFVAKKGEALCFEGLTYEPNGRGVTIYVAHPQKDGTVEELVFDLARSK